MKRYYIERYAELETVGQSPKLREGYKVYYYVKGFFGRMKKVYCRWYQPANFQSGVYVFETEAKAKRYIKLLRREEKINGKRIF